MPLQEKKSFIKDTKPNMTPKEKNKLLSTELARSPNGTRKIVRIERIEIGASGWYVYYRTGSA